MRIKLNSLRVRLTIWYVLLLALILSGFSGITFLILDQRLDAQVDSQLQTVASQAVGAVSPVGGQDPAGSTGLGLRIPRDNAESELTPLGEQGYLVKVINPNGAILTSSGPFTRLALPTPFITRLVTSNQPQFAEIKSDGPESPVRLYGVPVLQNGKVLGIVVVGQSLRSIQDTLHLLLLILVLALPITLVLTSAGGLFLANRALSPIDRITRTAQRISAEDLTRRINTTQLKRDDEVSRLANTFDEMLTRLEDAFNHQHQFTADASHELRTPPGYYERKYRGSSQPHSFG